MTDEPINYAKRATVGGLAALLAGCGKPSEQRSQQLSSSHDMLRPLANSGLIFLDSEGKRVNLNTLELQLSGNPSTLSFQFASCGDVCPTTGIALGQVSQNPQYANVKHVVISTMPEHDVGLMESRLSTGFVRSHDDTSPISYTGLNVSGDDANTIVLYPTLDGTIPSITSSNIPELKAEIGRLQTSTPPRGFDLPTGADPAFGHTGTLLIYDGEGKKRGQVDTPGRIVTELPAILDTIQARGQAR